MKSTKIASLVAGISLLATSLLPGTVSAASATMSLAGATQSNGTFSTVVYENSDGPVSSAYLAMSFSQAVSGVSYDYSVGPFTTTDPSGGHLAQGSVTGSQPVARVSFTLASPGTVTASVDTVNSYLKGASGTTVVHYTMSPASAAFTYNAPAQGGMGGGAGTTTTTTSGSTGTVAQNTSSNATPTTDTTNAAADDKSKSDVKSDTTKNNDKKNEKEVVATSNASEKKHATWPWIVLVIVAGAAVWYALRNRARATTAAKEAEVVTPSESSADADSATAKEAAAESIVQAKQNQTAKRPSGKNHKKSGKKSR